MTSEFNLLQDFLSLRGVNIGMFAQGELSKYQLLHTLQCVYFSSEDLLGRLGRGMKFKVESRYHQCEDGAECTHHEVKWSGGYDQFKQRYEDLTDDCTREMLLSAADWAGFRVGSPSAENGDADIGE